MTVLSLFVEHSIDTKVALYNGQNTQQSFNQSNAHLTSRMQKCTGSALKQGLGTGSDYKPVR